MPSTRAQRSTHKPTAVPQGAAASFALRGPQNQAVSIARRQSRSTARHAADRRRRAWHIREFRYDDNQQRYLERNLAPEATGTLAQYDVVPGTQVWHDFVGTSMWNDYAAEEPSGSAAATPLMEYTHGMGLVAQQPVGGAIRYAHADMLGTTRYMTDSSGDPAGGVHWKSIGEGGIRFASNS